MPIFVDYYLKQTFLLEEIRMLQAFRLIVSLIAFGCLFAAARRLASERVLG